MRLPQRLEILAAFHPSARQGHEDEGEDPGDAAPDRGHPARHGAVDELETALLLLIPARTRRLRLTNSATQTSLRHEIAAAAEPVDEEVGRPLLDRERVHRP